MFVHRITRQRKKKHKSLLDEVLFIPALFAPFIIIPQIKSVWVDKHTAGVSLITWTSFAIISAICAINGFVQEDKLVYLTNVVLCIANFSVVLGVLVTG
jgi:uncharacterized protein with PQ loop repeat